MKFKRLVAVLIGMVMTVESVPAFVFAKEIDPAATGVIAAEEEEQGDKEETEATVSETTAKKEKAAPETGDKKDEGSKEKTPSASESSKETETQKEEPALAETKEEAGKEDKEPAQTEEKEPAQTEAKEPAETESEDEPVITEVETPSGNEDEDPAETEGTAETKPEKQDEPDVKAGEIIREMTKVPIGTHTSSKTTDDNALEGYFRKQTEAKLGRKRALMRNSTTVGSRLTGNNKIAYDALKTKVALVANGTLTSTLLEVPIADFGLGWEKQSWSAADLGVSSLIWTNPEDGKKYINPEASNAFRANHEIKISIQAVDDALLADCPFEMYWFDKTKGVKLYGYSLGVQNVNGEFRLSVIAGPTAYFVVSKNYAKETYVTDTTKLTRVNTAVNNAAKIVSDATGKTDYQKLNFYYQKICSLVYYDTSAAGTGSTNYGDPWQLISVFDGNAKTNVVCEGYAKAFMYLCELTAFSGDISCITATGDITGGGHMWNIVNMDDGKNYIVDVTNIDGRGNATEKYYKALFLAGYAAKLTNGYYFTIDSFIYDDECLETYTSAQLAINSQNYYIQRSVTVTQNANGTTSVDKTSAYPDDVVTVNCSPAKGYEVDTIKVNGSAIVGNTFRMKGVPAKVEATYRLKTYKVSVNTTEGGNVTASPTSGNAGQKITLTVTPDKGYALDKITTNGTELSGTSFTLADDDITVTASFKKIPYAVTVNAGAHGTATADVATAGVGETVTLILTPDEGYYAKTITVNGSPVIGNTFTMLPEKVTVQVIFDLITQAQVGDVLTDGVYNYKVTNNAINGTGTVAFVGVVNPVAAVSIPAVAVLKGIPYKVTKISSLAFNKDATVTSVYIGANVTVIESKAFVGCPKLVKINGGLRLKTIGNMAIINCPKLSSFIITSAVLSKIGTYAFYGDKSLKTVYINKTTKLTKKGVKKSLKGSSVKTVKVKKSKVKKYKKYFTKKNAGRKVKVKK